MRLDQLKEYNMRNIFAEKSKHSTQNMVKKLFPDSFLQRQN